MIQNTALQLARQVECAKLAGIYDAMFLAFGGLLGHVRNQGMVPGDDDLDVGFISEMITAEQEEEYVSLMGTGTKEFPEHGLYEYRREMGTRADGRLFWTSIRGRPAGQCYKCCHWFFWTDRGYTWHCKGKGALVKGIPEGVLEIGPEIEFLGTTIHVPKMTGTALDFWYPDWLTPRSGGNSSKKILLSVSDWNTLAGSIRVEEC